MTTNKSHDVVAKLILQRFCNMYFLGKTFKHTNACMFEARMHVCCFVILLSPVSGVILRELHIMKQIINSKLLIVWFLNRFWRILPQNSRPGRGGGVQMKNIPFVFVKRFDQGPFFGTRDCTFFGSGLETFKSTPLNSRHETEKCFTCNLAKKRL